MAQKYPFEEYTRVVLVTSIANISAPTVAEVAAGTVITCDLTKDGLNPGGTTNSVDSAGLCSRVDSQLPAPPSLGSSTRHSNPSIFMRLSSATTASACSCSKLAAILAIRLSFSLGSAIDPVVTGGETRLC